MAKLYYIIISLADEFHLPNVALVTHLNQKSKIDRPAPTVVLVLGFFCVCAGGSVSAPGGYCYILQILPNGLQLVQCALYKYGKTCSILNISVFES